MLRRRNPHAPFLKTLFFPNAVNWRLAYLMTESLGIPRNPPESPSKVARNPPSVTSLLSLFGSMRSSNKVNLKLISHLSESDRSEILPQTTKANACGIDGVCSCGGGEAAFMWTKNGCMLGHKD